MLWSLKHRKVGKRRCVAPGLLVGVLGVLAGLALPSEAGVRAAFTPQELAVILTLSPTGAPPADPTDRVADNAKAARLGQWLFFETRFSSNGKISCASCHQPDRAFTDGRKLARGLASDTRNTPTVLNAAFDPWLFDDGRADSLWSQALYPLEDPREFGGDRVHVAHVVYDDPALRQAYQDLFGPLPPLSDSSRFPAHARPVPGAPHAALAQAWQAMAPGDRDAVNRVFSNLGKAIEAYERRLISGDSPFDVFVEGLRTHDAAKQAAMSVQAQRGLKVFLDANCGLCHSGPNFTDGQFHNLGLPILPEEPGDRGRAVGIPEVRADIFNGAGRYSDARTGTSKDKLAYLPDPASQLGALKTPTLRNVALTAPYGDDGRFASLADVVQFYAEGKAASGKTIVGAREATLNLIPPLTAQQSSELVAFMKALTGAPLPRTLTTQPSRP